MITRLSLPTCLVFALSAPAADVDLTRTYVVTPPNLSGPVAKAIRMLVEEVDVRI